MTNKKVIAIFFGGLCLLFAAFWAGLISMKSARNPAPKTLAAAAASPAPSPAGADAGDNHPDAADTDPALRYIVSVAAFGTSDQADQLTRQLRRKYMSAYTQGPVAGGDSLYRVNIGPYNERDDAERVAKELAVEGRKGIMVLQQKGRE